MSASHQSGKPIVVIVVGAGSLLVAWGIWSGTSSVAFADTSGPTQSGHHAEHFLDEPSGLLAGR